MKKKTLAIILAVLTLTLCAAAGSWAWLTATTGPITNSFTLGKVDIELNETAGEDSNYSFKMIPGEEIAKNPQITVKEGSEECWLFVKIEESANLDAYISYTPDDGWTRLQDNIFYREAPAAESDLNFRVLKGDKVTVNESVSNAPDSVPTLSFTAFAVQKSGNDDAATAWSRIA